MKVFEFILELIGWLSIVATVGLVFGVISVILYIEMGNSGEFAAVCIFTVGIILGAIWATHIWRKHGTINYISRIRRIS